MMNEEKWFSKEIDAGRFYTVIDDLFRQVGPPFVLANMQIAPNGMFWSILLYRIIELGQEYSANPIQKECNNNEEYATVYGPYNIETTMFVLALLVLSWLKINIKKKTENGHCRNREHESKGDKPTGCSIGSKFHKQLYDNYLKVMEEFVKASRESSPTILPDFNNLYDHESL
ncbi:MAG: hypothetical protein WBE68_24640 [Candidatus Nitrosopolaris sp.]